MLLYADEDFAYPVVEELHRLGHDVLTAQEDGRSTVDDIDILARAHFFGRAVLTYNRWDFERLDRQGADHSGILSATHDTDFLALAAGHRGGRCLVARRLRRVRGCSRMASGESG